MNQRELVLQALRSAGTAGACLEDFAQLDFGLPYRARNVISELRRFEHLPIESEVCRVHKHRSSVARYFLDPTKGPTRPDESARGCPPATSCVAPTQQQSRAAGVRSPIDRTVRSDTVGPLNRGGTASATHGLSAVQLVLV